MKKEKWNKNKLENIKRYKGHLTHIASHGGITGSCLGKKLKIMTNHHITWTKVVCHVKCLESITRFIFDQYCHFCFSVVNVKI